MNPRRTRTRLRSKAPGLEVERLYWGEGDDVIAGLDEVGRGSWAGPLTVGAAVIPQNRRVYRIRDSKMLTESQREMLFDRIADWCAAWAVGHASPAECDQLGMSAAQRLAARRALDGLGVEPDRILLDGKWDFVGSSNVRTIVRGDATSLTIAAASILAKVTRDRLMRSTAPTYPAYDFDRNKGYPGPRHRAALAASGPTPNPSNKLVLHGRSRLDGDSAHGRRWPRPTLRGGGRVSIWSQVPSADDVRDLVDTESLTAWDFVLAALGVVLLSIVLARLLRRFLRTVLRRFPDLSTEGALLIARAPAGSSS